LFWLSAKQTRKKRVHTFRQFRESILQMSEAQTLLIDFWMGHANRDMPRRYRKQLLENIQWRQACAAKVGLGFTLPTEEEQVLKTRREALTATISPTAALDQFQLRSLEENACHLDRFLNDTLKLIP
jgi:hypothetical protein